MPTFPRGSVFNVAGLYYTTTHDHYFFTASKLKYRHFIQE